MVRDNRFTHTICQNSTENDLVVWTQIYLGRNHNKATKA